MYYGKLYLTFVEAADILNTIPTNGPADQEMKTIAQELKSQLAKDLGKAMQGISYIVKGSPVPLSVMAGIVKDFVPQSYLLEEEKIIFGQN
jgi:hypothetical protein